MKQRITFLLTAVFALLVFMAPALQVRGETYSYTFTSNAWTANGSATLADVAWTLNMSGGTISTFDNDKGMHFGTNNNTCESVSISTSGISGTITDVTVEASRGSSLVGTLSISVGETAFNNGASTTNALTTSNTSYSYTGSGSGTIDILWTKTSGKGAFYIKKITVTYTTGSQQSVSSPTFSPAGGTYYEAQQVTISCATEGATICYTTDGTDPDANSPQFTAGVPLIISQTTTVKAKAFKSGLTPSNIVTAVYTIAEAPTPITIAEARALADNEYAIVQGIVTFIDDQSNGTSNVYIQDETAGIDLYLNANTKPSTLALGDKVEAYGKKTVFKGLVELQGINGSDASQFGIISTGNTLPYAVKTIEEILSDNSGSNLLQSTRVKIESATIGAINTAGNTPLTQGTNSVNIYKVPELTGITEGNTVDVFAIVSCYNALQLRVANASDVTLASTSTPTLNASVTQLTGFQYTYGAGPSEAQSFTITGSDLSENVTVTAPQDYEITLISGGTYDNSFDIAPNAGSVSQTVYVRMKAGLNSGSHTGNISITCGELSKSVALSGTVSEQPIAEAPTFSPIGGTYFTAQNVTLNTTTSGATIYYTLDESDPTTASAVYSTPITISTTTTIKAIAVAEGFQNSSVASATYTINELITIAQARALEDDAYAYVEGIVIFIDGRNVHIQDQTAGIDLYLNNNTVPTSLAIGDKVRAYGKKTVYNHLVELTAINGGNTDVFNVISTNNTLPEPAIQTVAGINSDFAGDNMIQSTRVKIEDAIIGAINTNGTTVITQDGSNLNIYRIPTVTGMIQGDLVTITGVVSCFNGNLQLRVVSADDILFEHRPVLTATPTTLSGFTYDIEDGGPSEIQYFELSGDNLHGAAQVYPSESFEVSTLADDSFHSENPAPVFNPGSFYDIKIYVRMKSGLEVGTYNEQLYAISEGSDTLYINVSGTVTGEIPTPPDPPAPGDGNYVRISDLSSLTNGSYVVFAARFDNNATDYYAMSNQSSGKPTGVLFTSAIADDNEVLPASIVDEESNYYWVVGVTENGYTFTNAQGELIGWTSSTNFATGGDNTEWAVAAATAGDGAMVPNYSGFTITNTNTTRGFALNNQNNFGPYAVSNYNNGDYNFYLDLFVKTEGGTSPTPTVATPTFTPAAGTYNGAQTVSIACSTEGATIHYTLDGTTPTESSPAYSTPLNIEETTTVKAIAMKEGYNNSNVAEATYTIQTGSGSATIFDQDWEGEMNGWTFVNVEGDAVWSISQNSGNHYAKMNGGSSSGSSPNEDWCISPAFNLDDYSNAALTFRTAMNYTGPDIEVFFSNDYDGENPATATWEPLTCAISPGSWTWTESGLISLDAFSGTNCYIGFKYISTDDGAAAWEVDDITLVGLTSDPIVTVTPLSLTGFSYIEGNGPSAEQSFTVSGFNLNNNVTITKATDYEISLTSGDAFVAQNTLTLSTSGGILNETNVYVRLKAGLAVGSYNDEDITIACADVDDIDVSCSGTVNSQPVSGGNYVRISDASALVAGNQVILAARYNNTSNAYLALANTLTSGKLTTTEFTSQINGTEEIIPADIMAGENSYYWTVGVTADGYTFTNANGNMIGYGSSGTNFVMGGEKTAWTITTGVSAPESLVPEYLGFNITNVASTSSSTTRAFALRVTETESVVKAYAISNMTDGEYNFFLDIFMQGEGGTPTVAAPTFTPAAGTYYGTQDVTLSCGTSGATIYYSLDSESGPWEEYEEAITVDESMTIWAYATKADYNDSPVVSAEYVIQIDSDITFNQDWEGPMHGWTFVNVEGEMSWIVAEYNGNKYANANGYSGGAAHANEDWCISPAFDLGEYDSPVLTFRTATKFNGPTLEVFFSNNYNGTDPTAATWTALSCTLSEGNYEWAESGDIDLSSFSGANCYIGFKYTSTDEGAAAWEVDDIMLVSGSAPTTPTLTATPNTINGLSYFEGEGPSASQSYTLAGSNLVGTGDVIVTASENFQISIDDEYYTEELTFPFADGVIINQPVTVYVRLAADLEVGSYTGSISHQGGTASTEVSLTGTVRSEDEPMINAFMPLYIQGNNGSNNNRVPVATAVYIENLEPNTTYRYTNQFVDSNDGPETAGAGNVIYANEDSFYRSTSPSLSTEGGYGEFTTDEEGVGFAWFINEPTANARFTPGNHVYLRIRLNDGHDGTTVEHTFTTDDYATVLNFGTGYDEYSGTAFYAKSNEAPMSFAMMFASDESERPIYSTSIETVGVDYGSINQYADFYKEEVAGQDGWFGGILPNDNKTGVNAIWIFDMESYVINDYYTQGGEWQPDASTINPTAGLDSPIFIDLTDDGMEEAVIANVKVWNTDHEFVIENGDDAHYMMTVYNVLGQPMMQRQINAGSTERISHSLASGIYVINLQNNQNKVSVKVIVR